ncbi:MAG: endonuclease/exonuclease/phosphatase family protein [Pseudomonadota bacterium]
MSAPVVELQAQTTAETVRIAIFNTSLARKGSGQLIRDIEEGDDRQVRNVAEIILRVRPDILVLNEFDHDPSARALTGFRALLEAGVAGQAGLAYPHAIHGPVNTGVPSGHDLDGDGRRAGPRDAFGFGRFPGQYGMAVLSRYPARLGASFARFRWADLPGALRPHLPDGAPYHTEAAWGDLRLSSKSHWQVPVDLPDGRRVDLLVAHPTPPVFDGPEDLNGRRNADEIRLLLAMIEGAPWLIDDQGARAEEPGAFVVLGDLNADPVDGESRAEGIGALLSHPRVQDPLPTSAGARQAASQGGANAKHQGKAERDTADWRDKPGPGNMRVDYALPSVDLEVVGSGVFWPRADNPLARLVKGGFPPASSDHRLVWVDIRLAP